MNLEYRAFDGDMVVQEGDEGRVRGVFALLGSEPNLYDDVMMPGSIGTQDVSIMGYDHRRFPHGKAVVSENGGEAVFDGQLFLDTASGSDLYAILKHMGGAQAWSYGFIADEYEYDKSADVRYVKKAIVYEVSPVLLPGGEGTRTTEVRSAPRLDWRGLERRCIAAMYGQNGLYRMEGIR